MLAFEWYWSLVSFAVIALVALIVVKLVTSKKQPKQ